MTIKQILDKAIPITPGDKGCRFKLEAKNRLRAEVQQMIEQYAHRGKCPICKGLSNIPSDHSFADLEWEHTEDGAMIGRPKK